MAKKCEFLVFMEAKDSAEGLVRVATREKVYKCLEACQASWKGKNTLISRMFTPEFHILD